jgi:hypothetical protein
MHVKLVSYTSGEKRIMAVIRVVEEKVQIEPEAEMPLKCREQLQEDMEFYQRTAVQRGKSNEEGFLRWLPHCISGSYVRAQFVAKE